MSRGNGLMRFISMMLLALVLVIGVCGGVGAGEESQHAAINDKLDTIHDEITSLDRLEQDCCEDQVYKIERALNGIKKALQKENKGNAQVQFWYDRMKELEEHMQEWAESEKISSERWYWALTIFSVLFGVVAIFISIMTYLAAKQQKAEAKEKMEEIENLVAICKKHADQCALHNKTAKKNSEEIIQAREISVTSAERSKEQTEVLDKVSKNEEASTYDRIRAAALKYQEKEKWKEALITWETASEMFPQKNEPFFAQAYIYQDKLTPIDQLQQSDFIHNAEKKYQKSLLLNPNDETALNNLANIFSKKAELSNGEIKKSFFNKAEEKYIAATTINPSYDVAWNNWGTLLANRARQTTGEEKVELWNKAEEKFKKATDVNPELSEPWNNWAVLLADRAKQTTGEEKEELWDKAEEKFKTATDVQPDYPKGWYNWANLLGDRAKQANGGARLGLWDGAEDKYQKATDIKPEFSEAWCNWALLLADRAKQANGENRKDIWDNAEEKFKITTYIKPEDSEAWCYWALLLADRAKQTNGKEREVLWDKAEEKYKKATDIKPEDSEAWHDWAVLLDDRAAQASGDEKLKLWDKAEQKYKKATDIKPELYDAWNNWANTLIQKATVNLQNIDNNLLEQAKEKALRAENILEGNGAYNLACITSLQNNFEECKKWLIKSKEIGVNFVDCNHLKSDTDLDNICTHPDYKDWFNDFVEQVCQEEQEAAAREAEQDETDSE